MGEWDAWYSLMHMVWIMCIRELDGLGVYYDGENSATLRMLILRRYSERPNLLRDLIFQWEQCNPLNEILRKYSENGATLRMKFLGDTVRTVRPFEWNS
jgi:hypothetical protein